MIYILLSIIGAVFGSFFLVVGLRLPKEEPFAFERSHCDNCKHVLSWYELIPIFSYLFLGGKCRKCGSKIPLYTLLIEVITGALFCLGYYLYSFSYEFYAFLTISSLAIIIFVSDFKYFIINDSPLFISIAAIIILKYIYFGLNPTLYAIASGLVLFATFFLVKLFGDKAFKKESLGGGDIKLSILIGVVLGIKLGLTAFILSAFLALPYAIIVSLSKKNDLVPYGPFLIFSLVIVFIFMSQFESLLHLLFMY